MTWFIKLGSGKATRSPGGQHVVEPWWIPSLVHLILGMTCHLVPMLQKSWMRWLKSQEVRKWSTSSTRSPDSLWSTGCSTRRWYTPTSRSWSLVRGTFSRRFAAVGSMCCTGLRNVGCLMSLAVCLKLWVHTTDAVRRSRSFRCSGFDARVRGPHVLPSSKTHRHDADVGCGAEGRQNYRGACRWSRISRVHRYIRAAQAQTPRNSKVITGKTRKQCGLDCLVRWRCHLCAVQQNQEKNRPFNGIVESFVHQNVKNVLDICISSQTYCGTNSSSVMADFSKTTKRMSTRS